MKPLNYAILKYFTTVKEGCADSVMKALEKNYSKFKAFNKKSIINALMTAEANGLVRETRVDLDNNNELVIYYHANEESIETINRYIKD